jgi:hypothetical protein
VYIGSDIHLNYTASDDGTLTKILIIATGAINQTTEMGTGVSGSLDIPITNVAEDASIFIKARATDDSGKTTTSDQILFTTQKDTIPPIVNLTSPPGGSMSANTGNPFTVSADVTDNVKVNKVEFTFNGNTVLDTVYPYRTDFTAPSVDVDTSYAGTVKAYDLEGNTTVIDFTIVVKPLLPLPGHYVKRYGDNTFQITPLPSTPARWTTWGPIDLKYYPNILFTAQLATCCGENVPAGSSIYFAYSTDTVSWTPFFSWDLPSHSNGYFDNYVTVPAAAQSAGPVFIAFFSTGGDNKPHNLFTGHVAIQLEGFSSLSPVFRFETGTLSNAVFPFGETEWPNVNSRIRWDLTNFSRLRFTVSGVNTAQTFAQLTIQYFDVSTGFWKYVGGGSGNWVNLKESPAVSSWIDLEPQNRSDVLLRYVVRDGDGIVKGTFGKSIVIELQSSTDFSRLLISKYLYINFGNDNGTKVWTDMPSAETDLTDYSGSSLNAEYRIPASSATQLRIRTQVIAPGATTARLRLKYWNGSSWQSFSESNPEISLATAGEKVSTWTDLPAAAKQNALRIRFFGVGGNFTADPEFITPQFEIRGPLEQRTP